MKYTLFLLLFLTNNAYSQEKISNIILKPFVIESSLDLSFNNKESLESKLNAILSKNDILIGENSRFLFSVKLNLIDKQITSTIPAQIILKANLIFSVGDGIEGIKYNSLIVNLKGIGVNEEKAMQDVLKSIDIDNSKFHNLLEKSKLNIVNYYNSKCEIIIKASKTLVDQNLYDEAIFNLAQVPENCNVCYNKCLELIKPFYLKKIDYEGTVLFNKSKNLWVSNPNREVANEVTSLLSEINPNCKSFKDALVLQKQISQKILDLDSREWNLKVMEAQNNYNLSLESIKATKEILLVYAQRKPVFIYNYNLISRW
jgi:hypothetical protein